MYFSVLRLCFLYFFVNDTATTDIYTYWHTLSLHDSLPISAYSNHAQTPVTGVVDGVIGRAAQFDGTAPLMLPASPSQALPAAGAFTFSAWVRADQIGRAHV